MGVEGGPQKKMTFAPQLAPDKLSEAFEHSITWEDDLWRADPVDVPEVHAKARRKFNDLVTTITSGRGFHVQERILLFHGQSGAGKTHLLRALRTEGHRSSRAYFGYAQMTPDVANYADFFSFGTNDLTQTTMGLSRDDSGRFLGSYVSSGIFQKDPFGQ